MTQPRVRHFRLCMEHQVLGTSHRDIRSPVVFSGHIMVSSRPNSLTHTDTRVHGTADVEAQFRIAEYAFLAYVSRSLVHQHMLGKIAYSWGKRTLLIFIMSRFRGEARHRAPNAKSSAG